MNICKVRAHHVIDFAAEELKKYLRMMMPEKSEIPISFDPHATEGFRLGLLEDFGLSDEGCDPILDDIIHIDATVDGGILAGSNPRSVLFAVYRLLKLNGCRFFYPGPSGEVIPHQEITETKYHKLADHRFRGHTIEGSPSLEHVLSYIDFHAKEELNAFGLYCVDVYQRRFYEHQMNRANRPAEPYDGNVAETQWRALYESEVKKRGLILFSGEHDMIPAAVGFDLAARELYRSGEKKINEEIRPYLAQLNGKRDLFRRDILCTNLCYSNPKVRTLIADQAVIQAKQKPQLDYLGFTVADGSKNHCECPECTKKRPSDWYVMILNEIDEKFTKENIPTKVLFSFYVDMIFAPTQEKLNNPSRFLFQFCPISRSYSSSITEETVIPAPKPFQYNAWEKPTTAAEAFALFLEWKDVFSGPCSVFEYHFWRAQYRDPGSTTLARRLYEDTLSHKVMGTCGCMQDGSNRSFWPNGFAGHIYAETLMNRAADYEQEQADYYEHLYGADWQKVLKYLTGISKAFDFAYMQGECSSDPVKGPHYNPQRAEALAEVKELTAELRSVEKGHKYDLIPTQGTAWRMLLLHAEYCEGLAEVFTEKSLGHNRHALELFRTFLERFGKHEIETERYLDFGLAAMSLTTTIKQLPVIEQ